MRIKRSGRKVAVGHKTVQGSRISRCLRTGALTGDEKHCLGCFYHCKVDGYVCCEFILVTGRRRGCDFGLSCTRYLEGDPSCRWNLPEDVELEPGCFPGESAHRNQIPICHTTNAIKRIGNCQRVALDLDALEGLKRQHSYAELAEATGASISTWKHLRSVGAVNPRLAERVLKAYGVDIIKRE